MDPVTATAIAGIGAGVVGGIFSAQEREAQRRQLHDLMARIDRVRVPTIQELTYDPRLYEVGPVLDLEELSTLYTLGPSALENIQLDPQLRADYLTALNQARQRALRGFTEQDQALLNEYLQSIAQQQQAAQQQILQDAQRRGVADSGQTLIAALQGSQSATNQGNRNALQTAAMRLQQQQQANAQLADLAQNIEQSDYNRALTLAKQRDYIEQFNKNLQQQRETSNVNTRNEERQTNRNRQLAVQDRNVDLLNQASQNRINALQWQTQTELQKAMGAMTPGTNLANFYGNQASAQAAGAATLFDNMFNLWASSQKGKNKDAKNKDSTTSGGESASTGIDRFSKFGEYAVP